MHLGAYLDRIGFAGAPRADLDTLTRLHRGHLENIPYENLDVLLGRPLDFDAVRIFDKLVARRRGGWCYEMNGLLAWALEEIGFRVTRLAGAVRRNSLGDWVIGNHLVLLVHLQRDFIADVGFGDGLYEPAPLAAGPIAQHGFQSAFEQIDDGWWRYHNHQNGGAPSFDFRTEPAQTAVLAERCAFLQTSDASPFTQNAVIQRRFADRVEVLRNSLRLTARPNGAKRGVIADADEYVETLRDVFGLDIPEARGLWPLAERRGREMLEAEGSTAA
jgi:N-hydroxyarylamine O-acetyltransferase